MELAMLIVTAFASVPAIASAVIAIVQARAAARSGHDAVNARNEARQARNESERLAGEANAAFVRQAEAQERANEMRQEEMRPDPWSPSTRVSGNLYRVVNTSGRRIKVESFEVDPAEAEGLIRIQGPEDGSYDYGDSFDYIAFKALSLRVRKLTISWRFWDEPSTGVSRYIIPL